MLGFLGAKGLIVSGCRGYVELIRLIINYGLPMCSCAHLRDETSPKFRVLITLNPKP